MIYLASASPRRRELLAQIGVVFAVLAQQVDETVLPGESPEDYVRRIAETKVDAALHDGRCELPIPVLGADTTVIDGGVILGKPRSLQEGLEMLGRLSGRTHQVLTAVTVTHRHVWRTRIVRTAVSFRSISDEEIRAYWASGEPQDKAGAYGIQGRGALFVESIAGSYSNVVGLPLFETAQLLAEAGISSTGLLAGSAV
jgi:septum formation protein